MKRFVVKCFVLIDTLKFCGVMMADHLFNIGLGGDQTGHYDLRGEGVWGLDTNCYYGLGLGLEVQFCPGNFLSLMASNCY